MTLQDLRVLHAKRKSLCRWYSENPEMTQPNHLDQALVDQARGTFGWPMLPATRTQALQVIAEVAEELIEFSLEHPDDCAAQGKRLRAAIAVLTHGDGQWVPEAPK